MKPKEFATRWNGKLQIPEIIGTGLSAENIQFLNSAGLPRIFHCEDIRIGFRTTVERLTTYWKSEHDCSLTNARGLWVIADVDTCGGAFPYFLSIKQNSGQIYCVWLDENDTTKIVTRLLSESLCEMAECMVLIQDWYTQTKGALKKGAAVIELCRVFQRTCFSVPDCKEFWMTTTESIFNADAIGDEWYPVKVDLEVK